jgi:hypothetical protein
MSYTMRSMGGNSLDHIQEQYFSLEVKTVTHKTIKLVSRSFNFLVTYYLMPDLKIQNQCHNNTILRSQYTSNIIFNHGKSFGFTHITCGTYTLLTFYSIIKKKKKKTKIKFFFWMEIDFYSRYYTLNCVK